MVNRCSVASTRAKRWAMCLVLASACDTHSHRTRDAATTSPIAQDAGVDDDAGTSVVDPATRPRVVRQNHALSREAERNLCTFTAGALPNDTLDPTAPRGEQIPIDHFIVIMQENRSFDEYLELLPLRGVPDADVAPLTFSNPDPLQNGARVPIFHETQYCGSDIGHDSGSVQVQYANGAMSGFVASAQGDLHVMGYFDEPDLPYYYALARTFAIGDHYFSGLLGPTWPNRMFAQSATAFDITGNQAPPDAAEQRTIYHQLQGIGQSWILYSDTKVLEDAFYPRLRSEPGMHFASMQSFYDAATSGNLPSFSWVESRLTKSANGDDEHSPADVQFGERFVADVIGAAIHGPAWARTAIFVMYDEHGGFFDHVPPPPACAPDPADSAAPNFERYGMRVPFFVISPYAKAHYVSHVVLSHTSILRMVQTRFDLPALSARDANATPPFDLFDFNNPAFMDPPDLPVATIDATEEARCRKQFQ